LGPFISYEEIGSVENMVPGTVFTTLYFLHILNKSPVTLSVRLHLTESPANNKHSSLLGQFISDERK